MKSLLEIVIALLAIASVMAQAGGQKSTIEGAWFDDKTKRTITIGRQGEDWSVHGFTSPNINITRVSEQYIFLSSQPTPKRREDFMLELAEDGQSLRGYYIVILSVDGFETQGSTAITWRRVRPIKRK